jgi:hypothetical protein
MTNATGAMSSNYEGLASYLIMSSVIALQLVQSVAAASRAVAALNRLVRIHCANVCVAAVIAVATNPAVVVVAMMLPAAVLYYNHTEMLYCSCYCHSSTAYSSTSANINYKK